MKKELPFIYIFIGLPTISILLFLLAAIESGISFKYYNLILISAIIGLIPYIQQPSNIHQISPSRLFAFSILVFILARPLINIFTDTELVEVGNGVNDQNIFNTMIYISLFIWISGISFISTNAITYNKSKFYSGNFEVTPRFKFLQPVKKLFFTLFILSGIIFLLQSINAARMMSGVDYFTVVNDPSFHRHLFWFFLSKNIGLFWILCERSSSAAINYVKYLLLFSFGFLAIGLRGYFVAYFFCFIYFYYEKRRINIITIAMLTLIILYFSSLILEYRLGFNVFDDLRSMIVTPFHQQGATFEVVFGAVTFTEKIIECIPIYDYIFGDMKFGDCVDAARNVPFLDGGFASSAIAEAIYLGIIPFTLLAILIGFSISFLQNISVVSKNSTNDFIPKLILLSCLPNLVYIGRSSAFDFVLKLFTISIISFLFFRIIKSPQQSH